MKSRRHGTSLPCCVVAGALLWLAAAQSYAAANIHSAVLPTSRSVQVGTTATFFATIVNDGDEPARGCRVNFPDVDGVDFSFQRSRSRDNSLIGERNESANIPAGGQQSFVISFDARASVPALELAPVFMCDNTSPAPTLTHINTMDFSASSEPMADIISFALTGSADGRLEMLSELSQEAFVVAIANLGDAATIEFSAALTQPVMPLNLSWCQTDPLTSRCSAIPVSEPIEPATLGTNDVATFAVFAVGRGNVAFQPTTNRIEVTITENGEIRSRASVAPFTRSFPQDPDASFGLRGEIVGLRDASPLGNNGRDLIVLPDGKIVVAAYEWSPQGFAGRRVLTRFNTDGSRDLAFGFEQEEQEGQLQTLLLQSDGKLVVGGTSGPFGYVSRHNADGSADISFGENGQTAPTAQTARIRDIGLQKNSEYVALGEQRLWRYTADGVLDPDFAETALGLDESYTRPDFFSLGILPDNKILVTGTIGSIVPSPSGQGRTINRLLLVARFQDNGLLDPDFHTDGLLLLSYASGILEGEGPASSSPLPRKIAVLPDGAALILTEGSTRMIKLTPSGDLDASYGVDGIARADCMRNGGPFRNTPFNMTVLADQRVVVTGLAFDDTVPVAVTGLERYLPNGTTDLSFGRGGCLIYQYQPSSGIWEWPAAVAAGSDDSLFVLSNLGNGEFSSDGTMLLLKLVESP